MSVQYTRPLYYAKKVTEAGFWQHRSGNIYQILFMDDASCFGYSRNPDNPSYPLPLGFRNSEEFYKLPEGSSLDGTPTIKVAFPDILRPDIEYASMDYNGDIEFWTDKPIYSPAIRAWTDSHGNPGIKIEHIDLSWLPDTSDKPFICIENVPTE